MRESALRLCECHHTVEVLTGHSNFAASMVGAPNLQRVGPRLFNVGRKMGVTMNQNGKYWVAALVAGLVGFTSSVWADSSKARCSNATLKGTYSFAVQGSLSPSAGNYVPEAYAGFVTYDGLGNIWLQKASAIDGVWSNRGSTGIYSIGNDCVGIATYPGSGMFQYFVSPDGNRLDFVKVASFIGGQFVDTPDRLSSTAVRVSKKALIQPPPG